MLTVGPVDPYWQENKLARVVEALNLVRERRERRKAQEEQKAARRMQLIMGAAEKDPSALKSDTVRRFVEENATLIPGLQEWYDLERAALDSPTNSANSYEAMLRHADQYAGGFEPLRSVPGFGDTFGAYASAMTQGAAPFDHALSQLAPSERIRALQHANRVGAEVPLSPPPQRPEDPHKKLSGSLAVLNRPDDYTVETVEAARRGTGLTKDPEKPFDPTREKLSGSLYVIAHPDQFPADVVEAARIALRLKPGVEQRSRDEREGRKEETPPEEKNLLTEGQAINEVDRYLADLFDPDTGAYSGAQPLPLTPTMRRKAAAALRRGEDPTDLVLSLSFPNQRALDGLIARTLTLPHVRKALKGDPQAKFAELQVRTNRAIFELTKKYKNLDRARAEVIRILLEGEL